MQTFSPNLPNYPTYSRRYNHFTAPKHIKNLNNSLHIIISIIIFARG